MSSRYGPADFKRLLLPVCTSLLTVLLFSLQVETIGDTYVAVAGLPDPQPDHFIIMARFALDCKMRMDHVVKELENSLGPDTGDLKMRFGLHSGPVTGGVLIGVRARFQLFGDTVNTAARMES